MTRLSMAADAAIGIAAVLVAAVGLCITLAFRADLMPAYAHGGPREWVFAFVLGLVLLIIAGLIHDRVREEFYAGREPELPADRYYGTRIGWANVPIALFTTQPVWSRVAAAWQANDSHQAGQVLAVLVAHLVPSIALIVIAWLAPRVITEYRLYLHDQQYDENPAPQKDKPHSEADTPGLREEIDRLTSERDHLALECDDLAEQLLTAERVTEQQAEEIQRLRGAPRVESGWD
ncbi:hypothetical protein [Sciscionella sediminilitoris]|uniref:hypothetical protein n=1 Tax=Sciscionella sediminilitoris TaxID=1445613 RepID=UPI0012E2C742|nr:hypothetical protein [Sciscionella sp. SE31]